MSNSPLGLPKPDPAGLGKPSEKKVIQTKEVKAIELGFYDGSLVPVGTKFRVPVDFKGSWFMDVQSATDLLRIRQAEMANNAVARANAGQAPRSRHGAVDVRTKADLIPGSDLA